MTTKEFFIDSKQNKKYSKPQEKWDYIEDPTYQYSCGNMFCMTCKRFGYTSNSNFGSILYCKYHEKLIYHGEHLTHACELYQKNQNSAKI